MSSGCRSGKRFVLNDQQVRIDKGLSKNNRREIRSKKEITPTAQMKFTEQYPTQCLLRMFGEIFNLPVGLRFLKTQNLGSFSI